jgi:hypothetical protein
MDAMVSLDASSLRQRLSLILYVERERSRMCNRLPFLECCPHSCFQEIRTRIGIRYTCYQAHLTFLFCFEKFCRYFSFHIEIQKPSLINVSRAGLNRCAVKTILRPDCREHEAIDVPRLKGVIYQEF